MKKVEYSSLGLALNLSVPDSVEEFDKNAKRAGACLGEATNNVVYRGMLADFRYYFLHGISQADLDADKENKLFVKGTKPIKGVDDETGIARKELPVIDSKTKQPKMKDGKPVTIFDPEDSEAAFFKRVCAEKGLKPEAFQAKANEVAAALVFDASETEKAERGPAKLAQKYKDLARLFITGKKNLGGLQLALKKDLDKQFVPLTEKEVDGKKVAVAPDADENVESLGRLCKEWEAAQDVFSKIK